MLILGVILIVFLLLVTLVMSQEDSIYFLSAKVRNKYQCNRLCEAYTSCHWSDFNFETEQCYLYPVNIENDVTLQTQEKGMAKMLSGKSQKSTGSKFSSKSGICHSNPCKEAEICVATMSGTSLLCLEGQLLNCEIGYSQDGPICRNNSNCFSFTDEFNVYEGRISYYNAFVNQQNHTLASCMAYCVRTAGCVGGDLDLTGGTCYLDSTTWLEVSPSHRVNVSGWTVLQRICDWSVGACTTNTDCSSISNSHCHDGRCQCDAGYSIDGTSCTILPD